jgi:hypothetical protein
MSKRHKKCLSSPHHCRTLVLVAALDASSETSLALKVMSKRLVSKCFFGT